jgi:hypothetical protein
MVISVATKKEFTPEWNDNKKENNPIVVVHRAPTMALYEQLIPKPTIKMKIGNDGSANGGETEIEIDTKALVKAMLLELKNCDLEIDGKPMSIKNTEDLYGPSAPAILSGLVNEIGSYFQKILSERDVEAKN